jgi:hypothetical protein
MWARNSAGQTVKLCESQGRDEIRTKSDKSDTNPVIKSTHRTLVSVNWNSSSSNAAVQYRAIQKFGFKFL